MQLNVNKLVALLSLTAAILVITHVIVLVIYYRVGDPDQFDFIRLIDLDYEGNLPTLFSVLLFWIAGALFFLHAKSSPPKHSKYWLVLCCVFIFLGFDEGTRLHEEIGDLVEQVFDARGFLFFPWVLPYVTLVVLLALVYVPFVFSLNPKLRNGLIISAALFLAGAVGFEMLSAQVADEQGTLSLTYSVLYTIEETLEMTGLIYVIATLAQSLKSQKTTVKTAIV